MSAQTSRRPRQGLLAWLSLLFPLAASLAAQVTWGLRTGSTVLVVWGCLATVLLALSIHRWRRLPQGLVRDLAMAGVVVAVGGWTWLHTTLLLISELPPEPNRFVHYLSVALCIAAFLPIEGLAVLSVLALDARESATDQPATTAPVQVEPPVTVTESAADEPAASWAGPDAAMPPRGDRARDAAPAPTPLRRKPVTGAKGRTRQELVTAGRALTPPVTRGAKERTAAFRDRVEAGERAARVARDPDDERERVPA